MIYLMGSDSLFNLHTWHRPLDFIQTCDWIGVTRQLDFIQTCDWIGVTRRSDEKIDLNALEVRLPGLASKVQFVISMILGISSTEIRHRILSGAPVRYYLHPGVYEIIREQGLYQTRL